MAFFNPSNQLLQIDTGNVATYLYNPTLGLTPYAGIGENQILGQRYIGVTAQSGTTPGSSLTAATYPTNYAAANASGSPAIYMLVQYSPASAITTANLTTAKAPAPVYWTDNTFTTVTGITTEGIGGTTLGLAFPAGYMMVNTTSLTTLTNTMLLGAYVLIQVAGYLAGLDERRDVVLGVAVDEQRARQLGRKVVTVEVDDRLLVLDARQAEERPDARRRGEAHDLPGGHAAALGQHHPIQDDGRAARRDDVREYLDDL